MSTDEDFGKRRSRELLVNKAFEALKSFQVDRRRIFVALDDSKRSGGYGIVRQGELHHSAYLPTWLAARQYGPPRCVAVKQIKLSELDNMVDAKRAFTKELLVWSGLEDHPGIAKFLGFHAKFENSEAWLLSPWEPFGNVMEFVHKRKLEVPEKLSLVHDTIDALTFLHQLDPPVCHGDIKSANVLINCECRAVLCDFGLARLYEDSGFERLETSTGFKGSIRWCSPEILDGAPRTPSSDIYAWAWLVWEIMTGELPYEGTLAEYSIIRKIFESPLPQVDGESRLSDCLQVWELMTRCWAAEPKDRPTASMCRTAVEYLPRCPPTTHDLERQGRSAQLLENLGDLESWRGNYKEGLAHLEQALQFYNEADDERGVASVLRKQAVVFYRHSYHLRALQTGVAALERCRSLNDTLGTAEILFVMGSSLAIQGQDAHAMLFLEEALEIFRANGNDVYSVQCLERIGELQRRGWQHEKSAVTLESAMEIARLCGDKLGEARAVLARGLLYHGEGRLDHARATLLRSSEMAIRIGWGHGLSTSLLELGVMEMSQGHYHDAEQYLKESISEAADAFEESCSVFNQISLVNDESIRPMEYLAGVKRQQGRLQEALLWWDQAIAKYRDKDMTFEAAQALWTKGHILLQLGRSDEAALHIEGYMAMGYTAKARQALCAIPKTAMKWERKMARPMHRKSASFTSTSALMCDVRQLQRRIPQFFTATLKLPIHSTFLGDS
ncbi:hypothetical protein FRB90_002773 [Tulasnella sp. 427]|nr:hypothetical protein FRB90_002773 [Tulasnella sp. 427]